MTQDAEMKELPAHSNSVSSTASASTLQHKEHYYMYAHVSKLHYDLVGFIWKYGFSDLKGIASLTETGADAQEARRIVRAVRLTIALRRKLKASVISALLNFAFAPWSEVQARLSSFLPKEDEHDMEFETATSTTQSENTHCLNSRFIATCLC